MLENTLFAKTKYGNYVYVPKQEIDNLYKSKVRQKKALPNTKVEAKYKLGKSNYKDEWYLIIESHPVLQARL